MNITHLVPGLAFPDVGAAESFSVAADAFARRCFSDPHFKDWVLSCRTARSIEAMAKKFLGFLAFTGPNISGLFGRSMPQEDSEDLVGLLWFMRHHGIVTDANAITLAIAYELHAQLFIIWSLGDARYFDVVVDVGEYLKAKNLPSSLVATVAEIYVIHALSPLIDLEYPATVTSVHVRSSGRPMTISMPSGETTLGDHEKDLKSAFEAAKKARLPPRGRGPGDGEAIRRYIRYLYENTVGGKSLRRIAREEDFGGTLQLNKQDNERYNADERHRDISYGVEAARKVLVRHLDADGAAPEA